MKVGLDLALVVSVLGRSPKRLSTATASKAHRLELGMDVGIPTYEDLFDCFQVILSYAILFLEIVIAA